VVDYHSCDFFPERFFDLVLVMRVDNTTLFDRLTARSVALHVSFWNGEWWWVGGLRGVCSACLWPVQRV
jgi:hypothetical protein